ncbi:MAG: glycosyl hydrolase family 43, partial [Spirochaetes bacterium]|nr:glycosyl hydrolase family 43 [Spirochaetota bacterium]
MKATDFLAVSWSAPGAPLIEPPRFSPVIADPSFLFPEETPTENWELFAHSAWGVHRYSSPDGLSWRDRGLVARDAMRPFARRVGDEYLLYYEKYAPLALPMTALPLRRRWESTIAVSSSADLERWSAPRTLIRPTLDWMRDPSLGNSVSNPCLVRESGPDAAGEPDAAGGPAARDGAWRLYFSASLSWIADCGFCEPRSIALAR